MDFILAITLLLTPAYTIKFHLFHFPTDILMTWVILLWIIFVGWLTAVRHWREYIQSKLSLNRPLQVLISLFLLAGLLSLFIHGFDRARLGKFIVLFLQPVSLFFIGRFLVQKFPRSRNLLLVTCYWLLSLAGIYAAVQYFTLHGLPPAWWGNSVEPKRALSFFVHPNFYALWAAPLLAFLIPDAAASLKTNSSKLKTFAWIIGALGLFLSLSRAGWLGLAAAVMIYLIIAADKKIRQMAVGFIIILLIIIAATPNLRYRLLLPFVGEKSSVSRLSLWHTGWKGIQENPLFGLGLTGFSRQWTTLNTDPGLAAASHNFPHNIFLDFWVESGLLGLISFAGIALLYIYRGLKDRRNLAALGVSLFLIAMIVQGQIDNPYLKNDLAMVFWIILSLAP